MEKNHFEGLRSSSGRKQNDVVANPIVSVGRIEIFKYDITEKNLTTIDR